MQFTILGNYRRKILLYSIGTKVFNNSNTYSFVKDFCESLGKVTENNFFGLTKDTHKRLVKLMLRD